MSETIDDEIVIKIPQKRFGDIRVQNESEEDVVCIYVSGMSEIDLVIICKESIPELIKALEKLSKP